LFRTKGCASCHNGPETEAIVGIGPDLSDAASWAGDRRPAMSAEDYVAESVRTPGAFTSPAFQPIGGPTEAMPLLDVSDAELDALVSYLLGS
jgi:mono/diheme cytochrome c family protein